MKLLLNTILLFLLVIGFSGGVSGQDQIDEDLFLDCGLYLVQVFASSQEALVVLSIPTQEPEEIDWEALPKSLRLPILTTIDEIKIGGERYSLNRLSATLTPNTPPFSMDLSCTVHSEEDFLAEIDRLNQFRKESLNSVREERLF